MAVAWTLPGGQANVLVKLHAWHVTCWLRVTLLCVTPDSVVTCCVTSGDLLIASET